MRKTRLEAFSDGFIAILITIMVLELRPPHDVDWQSLRGVLPNFLAYLMSFVFLAIYWNNHHHLLQTADRVNGAILWANLHMLFWLSLTPFATAWLGENPLAVAPCALYGIVLLGSAGAYTLLQTAIVRKHGAESTLKFAIGTDAKGKISTAAYIAAIGAAFIEPRLALAIYVAVAITWLVPDRRIERLYD
jgi:uncharacterized membrane protein